MKKQIVLCADDYGQAPAISAGIHQLLALGRLSAVSCLVNQPDWNEAGSALANYSGRVDIGLHFNLTHDAPISAALQSAFGDKFPSLNRLIVQAYLHQLDPVAIENECLAQLDRFAEVMGCLPDFIDGHQHVHQFPIIRKAVIAAFKQRLDSTRAYIRLPCEKVIWRNDLLQVRKWMIPMLGQRSFKRLLVESEIPHNTSFAGAYRFSKSADYPAIFRGFLTQVESGGLIMCHPGSVNTAENDPIAAVRGDEFAYFASDVFISDCAAQDVLLSRFFD
jgi:predicted glycoside hydrolase/deacetylase ChbG (UPF0249 family)